MNVSPPETRQSLELSLPVETGGYLGMAAVEPILETLSAYDAAWRFED